LYSKESETFRNIAVTAFVFYRTLYKGAYEAFMSHQKTKVHFDTDPNILYKRIPYKLYEFLGGQYWRIYEFHMLVEGDLSKLELNADIKDLIEKACAEQSQTANADSEQTKPKQEPVAISETVSQISEQTKKLQIKLFETDSSLHQLEQDFITWVQKQLDQDFLHVNERGVFSSSLKYGSDLFVEESVIAEFCDLYQKNASILKQILKSKSGGKIYNISWGRSVTESYRLRGLTFIDDELNPRNIQEVESGN